MTDTKRFRVWVATLRASNGTTFIVIIDDTSVRSKDASVIDSLGRMEIFHTEVKENAEQEAREWDEFLNAAPTIPITADEKLERALHYPDHWDTAAYPDVYSALSEVMGYFECECARKTADDGESMRPVAVERNNRLIEQLFSKHGGHIDGEGWCLNAHGLDCFLRDLYATRDAAPIDAQNCGCETCRPITLTDMRMIVCATCGNKRCPHATDHRNACTGSNEPGQSGSSYAASVPRETT